LWQKKLAQQLVYQPIMTTKGVVLNGFDGIVRTLNVTTGDEIWQTPMPTPLTQLKLNASNAIIASAYDGNLYALDISNGRLIWHTSVADSARFFYSNRLNLTASINHNGKFNLIDNQTGHPLTTLNLSGQYQVSPFITASSIWLFPDKKPAFQRSLNNINIHTLNITKIP